MGCDARVEGRTLTVLDPTFFARPVLEVAPDLLGCLIEHETPEGTVAVRLTEVEAYDGTADPGSHAFRGQTRRNAVMFGPPGYVYVYFTYGMHWCMNLVCGPSGHASAVLLRAGEVVAGHELAHSRRQGARSDRELARGPARLTMALGITGSGDGTNACDPRSPLRALAPRTTTGVQRRSYWSPRRRDRWRNPALALLARRRTNGVGLPCGQTPSHRQSAIGET